MEQSQAYTHVHYLWDGNEVAQLDPVERLVYRSNKLGSTNASRTQVAAISLPRS